MISKIDHSALVLTTLLCLTFVSVLMNAEDTLRFCTGIVGILTSLGIGVILQTRHLRLTILAKTIKDQQIIVDSLTDQLRRIKGPLN